MNRKIILDTETTGLDFTRNHRVIEIGCIEIIDRKYTGKIFHCYLNPLREIDQGAISIHGITNEFLKDKPLFCNIKDDLLAFISGSELIIHNASFDVGFIENEFSKSKHKINLNNICKIFDTLVYAKKLHPGQKNNLDALCKRYNIDNKNRDFHGALLDARILGDVYLAMTGGQTSFVLNNIIDNKKEVSAIFSNSKNQHVVIAANDDELRSHSEFCRKIQDMSKKDVFGIY